MISRFPWGSDSTSRDRMGTMGGPRGELPRWPSDECPGSRLPPPLSAASFSPRRLWRRRGSGDQAADGYVERHRVLLRLRPGAAMERRGVRGDRAGGDAAGGSGRRQAGLARGERRSRAGGEAGGGGRVRRREGALHARQVQGAGASREVCRTSIFSANTGPNSPPGATGERWQNTFMQGSVLDPGASARDAEEVGRIVMEGFFEAVLAPR